MWYVSYWPIYRDTYHVVGIDYCYTAVCVNHEAGVGQELRQTWPILFLALFYLYWFDKEVACRCEYVKKLP